MRLPVLAAAAAAFALTAANGGTEMLAFRHEVIDPNPPGSEHDIVLLFDVNGDGRRDIVIGGKKGDVNLFWYENPTWQRHDMASAPELEAGGVVIDVNRDGRLDIVAGQQWGGKELYWFEHPADPTQAWPKHLIENRFEKYHDQAVGDVDGDGQPEIVVLSQLAQVLVYYDVPDDPTVSPWPESCCHLVAEKLVEAEGLAIVDLDGDGKPEIVAGTSIYRPGPKRGDLWQAQPYAPGYVQTRVKVADLDGDGRPEIVLAEGESDPARVAICHGPDWTPEVLRGGLFHPHSLEIADFDGDGRADIFVGEMGLGQNPDPKLIILRNEGAGRFAETIIQHGVPTHEAKVADMNGDGKPDIVGKPYDPERHIDVWWNETGRP
jgi:FG-GAP-like repeat